MTLEDYKNRWANYQEFAKAVRLILEESIAEISEIRFPQTIQVRAKDPESLKKKLEDRLIINSNSIEEEIKDLAGVR